MTEPYTKLELTVVGNKGEKDIFTIKKDAWDLPISEILEMMESLLKASGLNFSGHLDIVEDD